jgi:hypothetical protein
MYFGSGTSQQIKKTDRPGCFFTEQEHLRITTIKRVVALPMRLATILNRVWDL